MIADELGEYLILKGFKEMDSSRYKRGNTIVNLGVRGGMDNWKITESGEDIAHGSGLTPLIKNLK